MIHPYLESPWNCFLLIFVSVVFLNDSEEGHIHVLMNSLIKYLLYINYVYV